MKFEAAFIRGVDEELGKASRSFKWSLWGYTHGDKVQRRGARGAEEDKAEEECGSSEDAAENGDFWRDLAAGGSGFIGRTTGVAGLMLPGRSDAGNMGWRIGDRDDGAGDGDGEADRGRRKE